MMWFLSHVTYAGGCGAEKKNVSYLIYDLKQNITSIEEAAVVINLTAFLYSIILFFINKFGLITYKMAGMFRKNYRRSGRIRRMSV